MNSLRNVSLAAAIGVSFTLFVSTSAEAFTFVEIASTKTSEFTNIDSSTYAINDLGSVAFVAELNGQNGIFVGDGGAVSTVVDSGDGFTNFSFVDINSAGTVVFNDGAAPGIYTKSGGVITPLITEASSLAQIGFSVGGAGFFLNPLINEAGVVAFIAQSSVGQKGLFTIDGGVTTTIAETPTFSDIFRASLNNNGEVSFFALSGLAPDGDAIFVSDGVGLPAALPDPLGFGTVETGVINDDGTVAFDVLFLNELGDAVQGIFTQNGAQLDLVVDSSSGFSSFQRPAINNQGNLVFAATPDIGLSAIFAGPDPVADRVIGIGDLLFGSTITSINFTQETGLNNQGQFAFTASFDDGSSGIFRADPDESDFQPVPEPASGLGLLAIGAVGAMTRLCSWGKSNRTYTNSI
jgi:hypothetical protein